MKNKAFSLIEISAVVLIIAILISGISTGIDLYKDFKFSTARQLTQNSRVPRISGLTLWLETTQEKSFENTNPKDGELIGAWNNIDPYKKIDFIVSQTNNADKPIYVKNYLNNELPALKFNGTAKLIKNPVNANEIFGYNNATIFVVQNSDGQGQQVSFLWHQLQDSHIILLHAPFNNVIYFDFRKKSIPSPGRARVQISNLTYHNKNSIFALIRNNSYMEMFLNGISLVTKTDVSDLDILNLNEVGEFYIGADYSNPLVGLKGTISEIIIYNRQLNSQEIKEVHEYLSKKHGIKIN
jgi:prepilin-type N-terminal cleavage/methylation domain-containing protein